MFIMRRWLPLVISVAFMVPTTSAHAVLDSPYSRPAVTADGVYANDDNAWPVMSYDGRFIAFTSTASNLVPDDTNGVEDVFVKDRVTGALERVSVASDGGQASGKSYPGSISADGRWVAFWSYASNLVAGDLNSSSDVFLHDRTTGETTRISIGLSDRTGGGDSYGGSLSYDGSALAFSSDASDLVPNDTNAVTDVFLWTRVDAKIRRVSLRSDGTQSSHASGAGSLSADGHLVAFASADALVATDQNQTYDVYVADLTSPSVVLASTPSDGSIAVGDNLTPVISADGRFVAFINLGTLSAADHRDSCSSGLGYSPCVDVYVRDLRDKVTTLEDVNSDGAQADSDSFSPSISGDGRYVTFDSLATNLGDGRFEAWDVFVHDRTTGATIGISDGREHTQSGPASEFPVIAGDGSAVAFNSEASDLAPGDSGKHENVILWAPCPLGEQMNGPISKPVRNVVEPHTGRASFTVHQANCHLIAGRGL